MFSAVGALAVYVTDKEKAKEFYTTVLGFEVAVDLGPDLCFLKSPNGAIDVYLEGGMTPSAVDRRTCRLSFFLRAEESAAVDDDTACFQLLDPDGNIIEVCGAIERDAPSSG